MPTLLLADHDNATLKDSTNKALTAATGGDLAPLDRLLEAVTSPYDERAGLERYAEPAPASFAGYQTFCGT